MMQSNLSKLRDSKEEAKFYSVFSENNTSVSLDFRLANGHRKARFYINLIEVDYHPDDGITLQFPGESIRITGRNLEELYNDLIRQRVHWLRMMEKNESYPERELCIEGIQFPAD